ncbi:hypothetical protein GWK47_045992 [Chionoecetes opilio]|uniref:Uncharacterized protein n=1 Tax=Chionoecetes opilio TaxID=41210 RepID=A0A8J4Y5W5_CHIOP|nr:hypothetical protein GWK47_045992 [Chionoecetes opilio]
MFHSFTGCDPTSAFFGKGKKSAWEAWNAYVEVTEAFNNFMNHPYMTVTVNCKQFQLLERFTVIIYNKTSNLDSVTRHVGNSSHRKQGPKERFPQRKKPFCSTHCAQSTKLESGQPVINVSRSLQPQRALDGLRECNEDPASCVVQPACSISGLQRTRSSVAAKAPRAEDDAHARGAVEVHRTMPAAQKE